MQIWSLLLVLDPMTPFTLPGRAFGTVMMVIAPVFPSVGLESRYLLLPLHYMGAFLGLLRCLTATMVLSVSLVSSPFLLQYPYHRGYLGLLWCIPSSHTLSALQHRVLNTKAPSFHC